MPTQSVSYTMHMDINANSNVPALYQHKHAYNFQDADAHKSHATCKVRNAILGPTPGNEHNSSTVLGTSQSKSSRSRIAAFLMYLQDVNFEQNLADFREYLTLFFSSKTPLLISRRRLSIRSHQEELRQLHYRLKPHGACP